MALSVLSGASASLALEARAGAAQQRPLLVVNPHAGANRHRVGERTRQLVEFLAANGVDVAVCVDDEVSRVREMVVAGVAAGCPLVIVAGGDGTIESLAPALVGSEAALGIVPLGTFNNIAAALQIPSNLEDACTVVVAGRVCRMDVGEVRAHGMRKPRLFFEQATVGLGPLLAPVGEDLEKGHWLDALRALPAAVRLEPVKVRITIDGDRLSWRADTLLVTICNTPRSAAALVLAPGAQVDDGQLDICVYDGLHQAGLAARLPEFITGNPRDQPGVLRSRAASVEIASLARPRRGGLLVAADADVVGETPARFTVLPAALRVICPKE